MDNLSDPPPASQSWITQTGAGLLISIPLFLLSAAVFTMGFIIYYTGSVSDEVDWQLANDLLADSANSEQDEALDEKLLESRKIVITTDVNPHL
ncbi:MAG: hypothetical protein AAF649_10540, partial [Verrucomicrobiota bacterium]